MKRTWATVDLGAVARNFSRVREEVGSKTGVMGVVKADAYGHGAVQVAGALSRAGVTMLGVGDSSEAIELREAGISLPIVILGAISEKEVEEVVHYGISPTVHSMARIKVLGEAAKKQNVKLDVHLMADTGMGRLGARPDSAVKLVEAVSEEPALRLVGLATHFATSQWRDMSFAMEQSDRFKRLVKRFERKKVRFPYLHSANSAAVFGLPDSHMNLVRPGIALYGMDPGNFEDLGVRLEPALSLKTSVVYLKGVRRGTPLGYDCTYKAYRNTKIATLPIGYNDGFSYALSNNADVIIRGRRAPVVGTVTMDYVMVEVGHIPGVEVGDEVTIIGTDSNSTITAEELAKRRGSIPYEVTCTLGKRIKRIYKDAALDEEAGLEKRKRA